MFLKLLSFVLIVSFISLQAHAAISPTLSLNADLVCKPYLESYKLKIKENKVLSYSTEEIPSHSNEATYTPDEGSIIPITFTEPFNHSDIHWLKWEPIKGIVHSFKWEGTATQTSAIMTVKPSNNTSLVLETFTIGWRGPFYRLWLLNDATLNQLVTEATSAKKSLKINDHEAALIYPSAANMHHYQFSNLFKYKNNFYQATKNQILKLQKNSFEPVCKIGTNHRIDSYLLKTLEDTANRVLMTKGITHISMYYGSMGSSYRAVKNGFHEAIKRPWLIKVTQSGACYSKGEIDNCLLNKRVDAIIEEFASSDPWSFREIQALKQHMKDAEQLLSNYYNQKLGISKDISHGMAKQAVYNFIGKTVSLHPLMSSDIEIVEPATDTYTLDRLNGEIKSNWFNKTSLMWAAHFNDYDAIAMLINRGKPISEVTVNDDRYSSIQLLNRTALTYAAENASIPTINALIHAGSDIGVIDSEGNMLAYYLRKNSLIDISLEQIASKKILDITPSFDCKLAKSSQEKAICASKGLSIYDSQLSALSKKIRANKKVTDLKARQRIWLKELQNACSMTDSQELTVCIKQSYRVRIKYLNNLLLSSKNQPKKGV